MMVREEGRIDAQTLVGLLDSNGIANDGAKESRYTPEKIQIKGVFYDYLLLRAEGSIDTLVQTFDENERVSANNFTIKVLDYVILDEILINMNPDKHEEFLEKFTSNINDPGLLSWIVQHTVPGIETIITEVISATLTDIKNQLQATTDQE